MNQNPTGTPNNRARKGVIEKMQLGGRPDKGLAYYRVRRAVQQATGNRQQATGNRQQATGNNYTLVMNIASTS